MTGGGLLVLMLLVSWASLLLQGAALVHLLCQRASYDAERLAGRGYVRTAACRVLAAAIYSAVALLAVLGVRIPGAGMLGPEALVVLTVNQAIWLANSAMDIRLRYRLRRQEGGTMTHPDERAVPAHEHVEREDDPWAVAIPDHPGRTDSPEYVRSRRLMNEMARSDPRFFYGEPPYQDHHGGGLWLKDADGWFLVRNLAGMEWSSQFAADPAKVDALRRNAKRLYAGFPGVAEELGIRDLLDTPITDADGVARWCDSVCNASVPLPAVLHTGTLPHGGGVHHYPAPIAEIATFKRDDFQLWVTAGEGVIAAVAPVAPRGTGDGRVHVLWAGPGSELHRRQQEAHAAGVPHILDADHPLAVQAFAGQGEA